MVVVSSTIAVSASTSFAASLLAPFAVVFPPIVTRRGARFPSPCFSAVRGGPAADVAHRRTLDLVRATSVPGDELAIDPTAPVRSALASLVPVLRGASLLAEALVVSPETVHRLRKIDVDAPVVDEHVVHLEIRRLRLLLRLERHERETQRIARLIISNHVAARHLPEPAEDDLQVLVRGDRVELAHEERLLRRLRVRVRKIPDHLQNDRSVARLLIARCAFLRVRVAPSLLGDPIVLEPGVVRVPDERGRRVGHERVESRGIVKRVVEDDGVLDAYVLPGATGVVAVGLIDGVENVETLGDVAEDGVLAVQRVALVAGRDEELRGVQILASARHGHRALGLVLEPGSNLVLEETRLVAEELAVDGVAAPARARGVTGLHCEVPRDAVEQAVVVVLDLA